METQLLNFITLSNIFSCCFNNNSEPNKSNEEPISLIEKCEKSNCIEEPILLIEKCEKSNWIEENNQMEINDKESKLNEIHLKYLCQECIKNIQYIHKRACRDCMKKFFFLEYIGIIKYVDSGLSKVSAGYRKQLDGFQHMKPYTGPNYNSKNYVKK